MLKSFAAGLLALLAATFGPHQAPTPVAVQHQASAQVAAAVSAITPSASSVGNDATRTTTASAPTVQPTSAPLIQQIADPFDSGGALADLASSTAAMGARLQSQINALAAVSAAWLAIGPSAPITVAAFAPSQRINQLSNITVSGVSGLTASDIPALNYLPLSGGMRTAILISLKSLSSLTLPHISLSPVLWRNSLRFQRRENPRPR